MKRNIILIKLLVFKILIISLLSSCENNQNNKINFPQINLEDFRQVSFELTNDLGKINIFIPNELDTFFLWVNATDYRCGDKQQYRFANSNYDLIKESGWYYNFDYDTVIFYQLTFIHPLYLDCDTCINCKYDQEFLSNMLIQQESLNIGIKHLFYRIINFENHNFAIYIGRSNFKGKVNTFINLYALLKTQPLLIQFEYFGENEGDFINRMLISLQTLNIE